jgi:hypothetical protein
VLRLRDMPDVGFWTRTAIVVTDVKRTGSRAWTVIAMKHIVDIDIIRQEALRDDLELLAYAYPDPATRPRTCEPDVVRWRWDHCDACEGRGHVRDNDGAIVDCPVCSVGPEEMMITASEYANANAVFGRALEAVMLGRPKWDPNVTGQPREPR